MKFTQEYLSDSISGAIDIHNEHMNGMGIFSNFWEGIKQIGNYFDVSNDNRAITTVNEHAQDLISQLSDTEKILEAGNRNSFKVKFERLRGIEYNPQLVKKIKSDSEKYITILAYKDKYEKLNQGIEELLQIYQKEITLDRASAMEQTIPSNAYPEVSFDEKFINLKV